MARKEHNMQGKWISIGEVKTKSPESPTPLLFKRVINIGKPVRKAAIEATALGIYELMLDGKKLGDAYFAPGFTSYEHILQYQTYEVVLKQGLNELTALVGGGWAVGRSTFIQDTTQSLSQIAADRPTLLLTMTIEYEDGSTETIESDESWLVTDKSPWRFGDWYDGEIYDATTEDKQGDWTQVIEVETKINPKIVPQYGENVTAHETFVPDYIGRGTGEFADELIYDFGQNFAGIVSFKIKGKAGQQVTIRHAEAMMNDGNLYVQNLRSAKQQIIYICRDGLQEYEPKLTYMGFRYVGISGIKPEDILELKGIALYSDIKQIGLFECSNPDLNRLQNNILWSTKSNFVDIPTDCPQRDERQGWTGDIALFVDTASFNFDTKKFLNKWLKDLRSEQGPNGEIPFVIPRRGGDETTPSMLTSTWGDSCILVPWAIYQSTGDESVLEENYEAMDRYMRGVEGCAAMTQGTYPNNRIWDFPFHFGDWCAPYGHPGMWLAKGPWVGTACWAYSCGLMEKICLILADQAETNPVGNEENRTASVAACVKPCITSGKDRQDCAEALKARSKAYAALKEEITDEFFRTFMEDDTKLKEEFQTGYVLPLYFEMGTKEQKAQMADHLCRLLEENDWKINTGFQSTPFILFALADNGKVDEAYRLLLQDEAPSWLYQVKMGATTTWEQWDSVQKDGSIKESSLNHYAYGAVGDFLYRRIAGLEPIEAGYKTFRVAPQIGGGLEWVKCSHVSPYGEIRLKWHISEDGEDTKTFYLELDVPVTTECHVTLPDGSRKRVAGGHYSGKCRLPAFGPDCN